jgi:hypothetical protein
VNISQILCEKSHSNRTAWSVYLGTFPNPFYEKRKQGTIQMTTHDKSRLALLHFLPNQSWLFQLPRMMKTHFHGNAMRFQ